MSKNNIVLIGFILLKFLLQYYFLSPVYDLHRDEFLHIDQADHLAWGYVSIPPVTSWISFVIKILGNSVFWIKFFPALFGALTLVMVWKTGEALQGTLFALSLGATCVLFSALIRINTLYQPNSLDVLCWTCTYYIVVKYLCSYDPKWLYAAALTFALGFLNKYNIVFLFLGFLPALAISQERKLLWNKNLYLAAALALLLILPNLVWQYQNNYPVQKHLQELSATQLIHVHRTGFLKSQLLFFPAGLFVVVLGLYALWRYQPFKRYQLFLGSFLFTLSIFLYFKAKDYYAIGLYPIYITFGATFTGEILKERKRYLQPLVLLACLILFIPMYRIAFANRSPEYIAQHQDPYRAFGLLRWEDGKEHSLPQDFADMLAWKELASKVDKAYRSLSSTGKTLVLCDNYGQAGAINYYSKLNIRAVSFQADYLHWFDLSSPYVHVIRVINSWEKEEEYAQTSLLFASSSKSDSIINPLAREYGAAICTFLHAKIDVNHVLNKEINTLKSKY